MGRRKGNSQEVGSTYGKKNNNTKLIKSITQLAVTDLALAE